MTLLQWLILLAVVVVVGAGYWFLRGRASTDPWRNLDQGGPGVPDAGVEAGDDAATDADFEGRDLGGDSYIVAVRTLTAEPPSHSESGGDDVPEQSVSDEAAEANWQAYKQNYASPRRDDERYEPLRRSTAQVPGAGLHRSKHSDWTDAPEVPPEPGPVFDPKADRAPTRPTPDDANGGAESDQSSARVGNLTSETAGPEPESGEPRHRHGSRHVPRSDAQEVAHESQRKPPYPRPDSASTSAQVPGQPESPSAEPSGPDSLHEHIEPQPRLSDEQEIFVIHVFAGRNQSYAGVDIHPALAEQGLRFGFKNLYHRVVERNSRLISAFGVANMINPGTLDPADQYELITPGLTLFMVAPGTEPGPATLRDMMETANALTIALGGQVLDDRHAVLKAQTAQYMLDRVAELDRRATLAKRR